MAKTFNTKTNSVKQWFKSIPWYGIIIGLALTLGLQTLLYQVGFYLAENNITSKWVDFKPEIKTVDGVIPLVPYFFIQLYFLWYIIFPIGAIISSAKITTGNNKREWINFMIAWASAIFIGGMFLLFCPSYVDRLDTAGVPGGNIFEFVKDKNTWSWQLLKFFLHTDQPKEFGCVPSFHCMQIIFCYLFVAGRKDKHIGTRIFWLTISILICLSTLFVKQHYFFDFITALCLSLICFFVVKSFNPGEAILKKCPNFLIIKKLNWNNEKISFNHVKIENKKKK